MKCFTHIKPVHAWTYLLLFVANIPLVWAVELTPLTDNVGSFGKTYSKRAEQYIANGKYDHAIADYTKVLLLQDEDKEVSGRVHIRRGSLYLVKKEVNRAVLDFTKAIELLPNFFGGYEKRARAYVITGDTDRAISDYSKMIEIESSDAIEDTARVISDYSKMMKIGSRGGARGYIGRGQVYRLKGDYDSAIRDFTKAIELKFYFQAYRERAIVYHLKGNYGAALTDYTLAITHDRLNHSLYYKRGSVYNKIKQYDKAIADWTVVIQLTADAIGYYNRGIAYKEQGKFDEAIFDFTKAIDLNSKFVDAHLSRSECHTAKGDTVLAAIDLSQAHLIQQVQQSNTKGANE